MERTWIEDKSCADFSADCGIIEKVLHWLEKEDGEIEVMAGTGLCLATVTYFIARMFQALF